MATGIDCDLQAAIDAGKLVLADLVAVVAEAQLLDFQELVARCPKYFAELPAPPIEAATKKTS
ncbi:hypothetical protein [Microcoleus sp.]|uniref:hypothetical protein n=1 Tax=Microcoleus sp. TaxID=44472 RepID=UPI00352356C9